VINQTFLDLIDRVFVLDRGRISAIGRHEDLLKTTPDYSRLLQMETSLLRAA
jgi:ABC-type multidrug transport system fused ATPase/permease subunit